MENHNPHIVVIGGGAAGFFYAINKAVLQPGATITILEKSEQVLEKVRISGGGRCNVTHHCFEVNELAKNYPRGARELISPFHTFQPQHTIDWFAARGVKLKTEEDGRMFPITDSSATITDCFLAEVKKHHIRVVYKAEVDSLSFEKNQWHIKTGAQEHLIADKVFIATGSALRMWKILERIGYKIVPPIPSLFTFTIKDERLKELQGLTVPIATIKISDTKLSYSGPLLITHWGISGPAVLKLSAFGAVFLHEKKYNFTIRINWTGDFTKDDCILHLQNCKDKNAKKNIANHHPFAFPIRLWQKLLAFGKIPEKKWADITKSEMMFLAEQLTNSSFLVQGKSTFKDEFVTCGGVDLSQINFKTYESKLHPNLYFGGEVLNVDAITGGFNFQHAWTSAWIAAQH